MFCSSDVYPVEDIGEGAQPPPPPLHPSPHPDVTATLFVHSVYLCVIDCGEGNTVLYTPERRSLRECIEYGIA